MDLCERGAAEMSIDHAEAEILNTVGSFITEAYEGGSADIADFLLLTGAADSPKWDAPQATARSPFALPEYGKCALPSTATVSTSHHPGFVVPPQPRRPPPPTFTCAFTDGHSLRLVAAKRWLNNVEVHEVLLHLLEYELAVPQQQLARRPASGTVLLFSRSLHRSFRDDGHEWRLKKNGRQLAESHEKLSVAGVPSFVVYYSQTQDGMLTPAYPNPNPSPHRRRTVYVLAAVFPSMTSDAPPLVVDLGWPS